jgi:hypothetical protein
MGIGPVPAVAKVLEHPLGCSGARLLTTLVHEMCRRGVRLGLATMCVGVGQGVAVLLEKDDECPAGAAVDLRPVSR